METKGTWRYFAKEKILNGGEWAICRINDKNEIQFYSMGQFNDSIFSDIFGSHEVCNILEQITQSKTNYYLIRGKSATGHFKTVKPQSLEVLAIAKAEGTA